MARRRKKKKRVYRETKESNKGITFEKTFKAIMWLSLPILLELIREILKELFFFLFF